MCVFCKIINGEIPCSKVYEDETVIAFLDISQATTGHTLVVPKKHIENIFELDEATASHLFEVVVKISKQLKDKLHCDGLNVLNNNGAIAGQSVNHYHIHLIPQYNDEHITFNFPEHEPDFNKLGITLNNIISK